MTAYLAAALAIALAGARVAAPARATAAPSPTPPATSADLRLALYSYDRSLPLNAELQPLTDKSEAVARLRARYHLAYDSVHDQRVTAIFTIPKRFTPPYPAVVLLAGSGGHKDTDYIRIASDMFSTLGYATISIDAQYHGERSRPGRTGDFHFIDSDTNRDAWIQTVVDLRRAVDFLTSRPDVDAKRIGYLAFSQGSMVGGTFIGVEPRIAVACLAVPGGGLVEWGRKLGRWTPAGAHEAEVNAAMTDPIYFIGRFGGRPLLVLSGKRDEMIPRYASDALFSAAREPKKQIWYDAGHLLTPTAILVDAKAFFVQHLGARQPNGQ